ncbi:MAG: DUF2513 domain-containing protein [Methanomicrobiaceae archaeon]|nr:DUF2513 domain-containing protein [Methanomicrobiaceae archaeon]
MKRDMDLVRQILLEVEKNSDAYAPVELSIEGYSENDIAHHIALLVEAGLLVNFFNDGKIFPVAMATQMTWAGHDFLDACRDEGRWQKAKSIIGEQVKSAPFDVLKVVLVKLIELQVYQAIT